MLAGALALVLATVALHSHAQNYPTKPVRTIIAFPPGSATDIIGRVTNVAYKGSGEILTDLMAGRVDAYFAPLSAGLPYLQSGKIRPLAVTSTQRASQLPDVPTIAESGVSNFEFLLWFGLWGPSGIPQPVLNKIRAGFSQSLADPGVKQRLSALGTTVMSMTPAQFSKFVDGEIAINARLFKAAGIKPQ